MEELKDTSLAAKYAELSKAYQELAAEAANLHHQVQILQLDRTEKRMRLIMDILEKKSLYSKDIVELAEWHLKQIMAKPNE